MASVMSGTAGIAAVVFGGGTNRLIIDPGAVFILNPAVDFDLRAGFAVRHNHCEQLRLAQGAAADRVDAL